MNINFPELEEKILRFWKKNKIFEKSITQRTKKKVGNFVFYDGPMTANARPGVHHVLARVYKDIICRFKTMQGFKVERKVGWDTHGLPIELETERELGLKRKKDILKYGIAKFVRKCRQSADKYIKIMEKEVTERIGYWVDIKNPYITYENNYIESVWWILKQIWQKKLLYQDYKVVPYCPRCGTSLSSHEVALGYKKIREPAIYVKLRLKNEKLKNTYLLIWTTTPWTLPGNVAVAVNPKFTYCQIKIGKELFVLAKERLTVLEKAYQIIDEFKGKELVGLEYEPLFRFYDHRLEFNKKIWLVVEGDFVSLEEGTGLVHIAPAFGEEDMAVGKKENLPILLTVDEEGKFKSEVKPWSGLYVKDADLEIIRNLKDRNLLFKEEIYEHDYPFCWRCENPLLYYAKKSWWISMQKLKKDLLKNNQKINWIPAHLKQGRFGEWLREVKDWNLSRERYWGTPLPIWQCKNCSNLKIIGSLKDLLSQRFSTNNYFIFRHGNSLRQIKKIAMCWPEKIYCPLTKKGKQEVREAAKKLKTKKIDVIFSSDLLRAKQSAEILAKEIGAKIILDRRLREHNVGIFNGKDPKLVWNYLNKKGKVIEARPPKGESLIEVRKRMYNFLKEINGKYQNKNILIVSHELPLTILEKTLQGLPIEKILEWRNQNREKTIKTSQWRKIEFKHFPYDEKMELDFHRPYIDEVKFYCPKCQNLMKRIEEVTDCWFDSGAMPFAQGHWPFVQNQKLKIKNQKLTPPELFPADYICEAVDQTRGWFYTLLAVSTLLGFGTPYKNVISLGHVLDEKGEKMSKSKGNIIYPQEITEKYGADALRWYFYTVNQPADQKLFSEKGIEQVLKKFILTFWNSFSFFKTYAYQNWRFKKLKFRPKNWLDKWIISRLNEIIDQVSKKLEIYDVTGAARSMECFLVEDLSQWYIRRSRRRFQRPETKKELKEVSLVLNFVLFTLSKLTAPFIPFLSEKIYQGLVKRSSVHLQDWPKTNKKLIDKNLNKKMDWIRKIVSLGLKARAEAKIKVRQPLQKLKIKTKKLKIKELLNLIKEELNVKEIIFDPKIKKEIELDTKITPQLKEEGIVREIIRHLQEMRKKAKLKPHHKILVRYFGTANLNRILGKNKGFILKETKAKDFLLGQRPKRVFDIQGEVKINEENLWLGVKKL